MFDRAMSMSRVSWRLSAVLLLGLAMGGCSSSSSRVASPSYLKPPSDSARNTAADANINYDHARRTPSSSRPKQSMGYAIRVARGDTLYNLSRRHSVSVNALMTENGLRSTQLRVGQTLYLPYAR